MYILAEGNLLTLSDFFNAKGYNRSIIRDSCTFADAARDENDLS
jgi:hypothetical protein